MKLLSLVNQIQLCLVELKNRAEQLTRGAHRATMKICVLVLICEQHHQQA